MHGLWKNLCLFIDLIQRWIRKCWKNPNITLGKREEVTGKVFMNLQKKISKKGATILGGCCETDSSHIKELSKLK